MCPHNDLSSRVRMALAELGVADMTHLAEYPRVGRLPGAAADAASNICFLDVATNAEHATLLIGEVAALMPVVALHTRKDADLILRCLRRGASEFLSEPGTEQLRAALDRLGRLRVTPTPSKPSMVYCVLPGKPGCGASTIATHMAVEFKRSGASSVLLVDTDILTGSIAFMLKLKPDFHLGDAVRDRQRMDLDLWSRLVVHCHGIDILLAPENPASPLEIDRQAAGELLSFWRGLYEAVVLDTGGTQPVAVEFARLADQVLLVSNNELLTLHATRKCVEYLEQNGIERRRLRLVVNRYSPATGLKREEVQTALKLEPYALMANEYETVQQAVLEGRPVETGTRFERSVRALAARLSGREMPADKKNGWLGLLPKRGSVVSTK